MDMPRDDIINWVFERINEAISDGVISEERVDSMTYAELCDWLEENGYMRKKSEEK